MAVVTKLPILYGMPGSLYTAKVRAYLQKRHIAFEERVAGDPRFAAEIVPQVGRWIIPVLQMPGGELIQDGADIMDYFESSRTDGASVLPPDPVLRVLAHVFELFGGEGLLRPAMHYRWNFDAENLDFLRADFIAALAPDRSPAEAASLFEFSSARMRKATLSFGVNAQTVAAVESAYLDFLARFEHHLAHSPYLLGTTPTLGDYALLGPLYPHLARDPYPASLMKRVAPRVWRWVERMNAPGAGCGEYLSPGREWLDAAAPGDTLESLLRFVAEDYLPELQAHVAFANAWLAQRPDMPAGTSGLPRPGERHLGRTPIHWRGLVMEVTVMPYRLYLLQRVHDAAARLDATSAASLQALLARNGLADLLSLRCHRRVERRQHLEVWGPPQR